MKDSNRKNDKHTDKQVARTLDKKVVKAAEKKAAANSATGNIVPKTPKNFDPKVLAKFQFAGAVGADGAAIAGEEPAFDLRRIDPSVKPFSSGDKTRDRQTVDALAIELDGLQNLFYADRRYKMLVVLQGTDTSGKDGTLRGVFSRMSPLGVKTVAWKAPDAEEAAHDPLWRIHRQVPGSGEVTVFNRSHYEDVLVPVVNESITPEQVLQRYRHINDFERMLTESGTVVLKFMLHISKDEQRERLQERIDDPTKHWKFSADDLSVRKQWDAYQAAYGKMIEATGTPWAPWSVVPANSKTHRNLMIAGVIREAFRTLPLRFPPGDPSLAGLKVE